MTKSATIIFVFIKDNHLSRSLLSLLDPILLHEDRRGFLRRWHPRALRRGRRDRGLSQKEKIRHGDLL